MFRLLGAFTLLVNAAALAAEPPSYARQIRPFFNRYCVECHNGKKLKGGLDLETYKSLKEGADSGPVFTAGKPDDSRIVLLVEHKDEPFMPPKKSPQPRAAEVALVRAWVAAGARDDTDKVKGQVQAPDIKPRGPVKASVAALAYRPGGRLLAAGGYQEVVLIDPATGEILDKLPGQTAQVNALAFSKDGRRLAVASGQNGAGGEVRLYTLSAAGKTGKPDLALAAHQDMILDLAFSPDGKTLATCGYDRLVKLWDVASGKEVRTLKDHSDAVYSLAFSPDGLLLASGAADRAVKVWEVASGTRLYTLGEPTDWVYAVAWSPDGRHLAAAGVDRSIRIWDVSSRSGKLVRSVFAHEGAVLRLVYSADGKALYSLGEDRTIKSWDAQRMTERKVYVRQPEEVLALALRPDGKQLALGRYDGVGLLLDEPTGKVQSQPLPAKTRPPQMEKKALFPADLFPPVAEIEPNDSPTTGQKIPIPASVAGSIGRTGDVDFYRFEVKKGHQLGVQIVTAKGGSKLEPVLKLTDAAGKVVAESTNGLLGYTCPEAGTYALGVRDREYRGGAGMTYRLHVGPIPIVTAVFPLGLQRGSEAAIRVEGVNLGKVSTVRVKAPADTILGTRLPLPISPAPRGNPGVWVGEFPEVVAGQKEIRLPVPGTGNGVIDRPGVTQTWRFAAKKGQRLIVEVHARRLGSPLDSFIEILDARGKPVERATLRCLARTYTTFRDHDSAGPGIRIETWGELAMDDYLLVGSELVRIWDLPRNPDDDCQFYKEKGKRLAFLGTTPTYHSAGTPMYKVAIHPPGTTFSPNGFPVVHLYYRNDDGGPEFGKDSVLDFDAPADGEYQVRIGDARGEGGSAYAYRLTVRPPRPDFTVQFSPASPAVWKGGAVPITVTADRRDAFTGAIRVQLENVPPGFSAPATTIPAGENSTTFALYAEPAAVTPAKAPMLRLAARALIDGKEVVRFAAGGLPRIVEPGDLVTTTAQDEVTVTPGKQVWLKVAIERRHGFAGRVPLDVRGLPHGIRVLDVGLNGILITEKETTRLVAIYCEPWVKSMTHPIVVLSRREGKNTEHAARSVLLRVAGK